MSGFKDRASAYRQRMTEWTRRGYRRFRRVWDRINDILRAPGPLPLLVTFVAVLLTWLVYHQFSGYVTLKVDGLLLGYIALGFSIVCVIMLLGTIRWSARACGLFCSFLAGALLYTRSSTTVYGHAVLSSRWALEMIRSLFLVGVTLLLYGCVKWIQDNRGNLLPWRRHARHANIFEIPESDEGGGNRTLGTPQRRQWAWTSTHAVYVLPLIISAVVGCLATLVASRF